MFLWNNDLVGRNTNDKILHAVIMMKMMNCQSWVMSSVYASTSTEDHQQGWNENHDASTLNEGYAVTRVLIVY